MRAIDLFAGLGGFTEAAAMAGGVRVVWAGNHWRAAVDTHALNHPEVSHVCQDLHQANWAEVPAHDVLLASPCCQGHSHARGKDTPQHDASRATAWAVVSAAEFHRPRFVVVENVPAFTSWVLYPAWADALRRLGYQLAEHVTDAADSGTPQHRVRLFLVASRSRAPLKLDLPKRPHVPASSIIRFDSGNWAPVAGHSPRTLARYAAGRARFGARFVMPYYGSGSGLTGRSLDRPLGTVTTRDRWALVDGDRMRMLSVDEYRAAMGFRSSYQLPAQARLAKHLLGNAVAPPQGRDVLQALQRQA